METITELESISGSQVKNGEAELPDRLQVQFSFTGERTEVRERLERVIREVLNPFAKLGDGCLDAIEDLGGLPILSIKQLSGFVGDPRAISNAIGGTVCIGGHEFLMRSRKSYVWDPDKINFRDESGRKRTIPVHERDLSHLKKAEGTNGIGVTSPKRLIRQAVRGGDDRCRLQEPLFRTLVTQDVANAGEIFFSPLDGRQDTARKLHRDAVRERLEQRWRERSTRFDESEIPDTTVTSETVDLGEIKLQTDFHSTLGPFEVTRSFEIRIPDEVKEAVGRLVLLNAAAFAALIPDNTEGDNEAYGNCVKTNDGVISEPFFQVDLAGLPSSVLQVSDQIAEGELIEILKSRVFEFEPSIAMYELIQKVGGNGHLGAVFREHLDLIRQKSGRQIALLAPTEQKLQGMRETEFGKTGSELLTDEEVFRISGFDALLGPTDFKEHLERNGEESRHLLYVRPSDPIIKLVDPTQKVADPLFNYLRYRQAIRSAAITINIDNPQWTIGDPRRLKDTKAALPIIGIAHGVHSVRDIISDTGELNPGLSSFLNSHALNTESLLRAKPMQGVYGGYGQRVISIGNHSDIKWLEEMLQLRGPYVLQPEIKPLLIRDSQTGREFAAMDRLFFSMVTGKPVFMGGIRILVPTDTEEAQKGRLHGTDTMISVPII